ncbi:hypothetical protein VTI28DRAFT_6907 [Corynascus sepedonium]
MQWKRAKLTVDQHVSVPSHTGFGHAASTLATSRIRVNERRSARAPYMWLKPESATWDREERRHGGIQSRREDLRWRTMPARLATSRCRWLLDASASQNGSHHLLGIAWMEAPSVAALEQ